LLSGGVVLASPAILHSRALTIWQHLTHTFPTEWTLADVILIVAALVFLLSLARVFKRRRETGRIPRKDVDKPFEERLGVAWKYDPNNGIPEYVPYCPMHHIKLVIRSYAPPRKMYQCVIDKQNWWFGDWEVNNAYEEVSIICQAKVDGSYRK
jgi:hypothetical protein